MTVVFQYGSNTSSSRLNGAARLGGTATPLGLARTGNEFELGFTRFSPGNHCGVADLEPGQRVIYGVLYEIPDHRIFRDQKRDGALTLDEVEGEGVAYQRQGIRVQRVDTGDWVAALTYLVIGRQAGIKTAAHYVKHIVDGLREFGAPPDYVDYVRQRAVASNPGASSEFMAL